MATFTEWITINGVTLNDATRFFATGLSALMAQGEQAGDDLEIPGMDGVRAIANPIGPLRVQLPLFVRGLDLNPNATRPAQRLRIRDNIEFLRANILAPYPAATTTLTHRFSDGTTRSGPCKAVDLAIGAGDLDPQLEMVVVRCALDVILTAGKLT